LIHLISPLLEYCTAIYPTAV